MEMNTTMVTTARAMTLCIAAALGFNAADASAGSLSRDELVAGPTLKYVVPFQDLDLSKIEGATALYGRLRYAARMVCEPIQSQQPGLAEKYRACVNKAIADAVAGVNRPLLSQYFQLRTKGDRAGLLQLAKAH
jgi:UrcA family protein